MILKELAEEFSGKKILLLGYGAEGVASHQLLNKLETHSSLGIADQRDSLDVSGDLNLHLGKDYLDSIADYDLVIKSPGIPLPKPYWDTHGNKITSQIELFLKHYRGTTIGITGTKGKTTTSSLLYSILSNGEQAVHLLGNIGKPVFSDLQTISNEDFVVLELSSHQLQHIRYTPSISVLLNLYPEHLEYYGSFECYRDAKFCILKSGSGLNCAFVNRELFDATQAFHTERDFKWISTVESSSLPYTLPNSLTGEHQRLNTCFAVQIAKKLEFSSEQIQKGLDSYELPPHRTEDLGVIEGIKYINDSAATIPEATIAALETLSDVKTLIIGGFDRGVELEAVCSFIATQPDLHTLCLPETGDFIFKNLMSRGVNTNQLTSCRSLVEAVSVAQKVTPTGSTCLFSPAAASYHAYSNYAERGNEFKNLVFNCHQSQ